MSEPRDLRERLDRPAPGEDEATDRARAALAGVFERRDLVSRSRLWPAAAMISVAAIAACVGLTPVGPALANWIRDTGERLSGDAANPPRAIKLPAPGRLLVNTRGGPWVIDENGSRSRVGAYRDAAWSPGGLYLTAADPSRHGLVAVTPAGHPRWRLAPGGAISSPRWAPSGLRIAYLAGKTLRIVDGDGSDDGSLGDSSPVPAAWQPGADANVASYVNRSGFIVTANADSGEELWRAPRREQILQLVWSRDGRRLAALSDDGLQIYDQGGERVMRRIELPTDHPAGLPGHVQEVAFSPARDRLALARESRGGSANEVVVLSTDPAGWQKTVYRGKGGLGGVAWSPDGEWLLVAAIGADSPHWTFVNIADPTRTRQIDGIQTLFGERPAIPEVAEWCCPLP